MKVFTVAICICLLGCSHDRLKEPALFTNITKQSGVDFHNDLVFTERLNPYTYRNFYNGAGVAIGDINNDGLQDILFAGNQADNKLYLNEGNLVFRDITDKAGVACPGVWSTGVTFADVNADGFLDIYVCKSGDPETPNRNNELFINNGDLTFTEKSKEFGLDITGLSVQAAFFDFDKDGDLDCYLLTNSIKSVGNYDLVKNQRDIPDPLGGGNKFLINDDGKFRDYSPEAGIYRSSIGFGLGITLGDFNNDTWTDIFVSNDFFERDYLYINDQHGAFKESLTDYFQSISMGSMGADFADLDNDGRPELFVTEMLPDSLSRRKTKTVYESWDKYQLNVRNGYHHQFPRNVLQKQVSQTGYVEVGRFAGISASEWSWGALLFDMDNDGLKDIFIANGIYKDLLDRDYLAYSGDDNNIRKIIREEEDAIVKLIDLMPSSEFPNYAFRNYGHLTFKNVAQDWGLGAPMYSSGSAYGDLDNDGDLDLVVNNINAPSVLYRNNTDSSKLKNISVALAMAGNNTFAVGSEIRAFCGNKLFTADNFVTRGFQSSSQPAITLGLGAGVQRIDSLQIHWPDSGYSVLYNVPVNKRLSLSRSDLSVIEDHPIEKTKAKQFRMEKISSEVFKHKGSGLVDFNRERLLPMMYGNETPSLLKGDINGDGQDEVYIGGGKNQDGMFIQFNGDKIISTSPMAIAGYNLSEETKGAMLDVDSDGDLDLYMATGGKFFPKTSEAQSDRIFINDGNGEFSEAPNALPFTTFFSTSVVRSLDFDNDGDSDLVVAERFDPFVYGRGGRAFLLENDGKGVFTDVTSQFAADLLDIGMVTDIEVQDHNNDGWNDLLIVGDWMPIVMLKNLKGKFVDISAEIGLQDTEGWWHDAACGDLNQDGRVDFVLGNHGLNSFFKPGDRMYVHDFDGNGSIEQVFCTNYNGKYYPIVDKDEFLSQLPSFKKSLLYYREYGKKAIDELIQESDLKKSKIYEVKLLSSVLLLSDSGGYKKVELPAEAQYSSVYSLLIHDFDNDGIEDVIAGGNQYQVKPQFGRLDASNGWFFKGILEKGQFSFQSGHDLNVKGEIRDIELVEVNGKMYILFAKYDDDLEIYKIAH
ncbi:MAG: VCBS repeat-containing protein [Chryseosolibacter sp.]